MTEPPLSRQKLVDFLKQSRMDTTGMDNHMLLYATGNNIRTDLILVSVFTGQFDEDQKRSTKTDPSLEEAMNMGDGSYRV